MGWLPSQALMGSLCQQETDYVQQDEVTKAVVEAAGGECRRAA